MNKEKNHLCEEKILWLDVTKSVRSIFASITRWFVNTSKVHSNRLWDLSEDLNQ